MSEPSSSLLAENIILTRDTLRILDGVSLSVKPGHFVAVIGPNGAGKSSLLSVMSGLWKADGGRVMLKGRAIAGYKPAERARCCAVMRQDNSRPAGLTVLEAVELGRLAHGGGAGARSVAWEMLQRMDLVPFAGRDCARLSGGEWQRVAFARTVAQIFDTENFGVLLLDEPVSSLDPSHQHELLAAARRLALDGHAVMAVLHDLNLTAYYADEVAVLAAGRLRACGPVAQIMQPEILSDIYGCRVIEVREGGQRALVSLPPEKRT